MTTILNEKTIEQVLLNVFDCGNENTSICYSDEWKDKEDVNTSDVILYFKCKDDKLSYKELGELDFTNVDTLLDSLLQMSSKIDLFTCSLLEERYTKFEDDTWMNELPELANVESFFNDFSNLVNHYCRHSEELEAI